MQNKDSKPGQRFIKIFLLTIVIIVIFAYGFEVTQINLEEPKEERRQSQLINVLRSLARPDLTQYETERLEIEAPIWVPCPASQVDLPDLTKPGPTIELSVKCAEPATEITVTGAALRRRGFSLFCTYAKDANQALSCP